MKDRRRIPLPWLTELKGYRIDQQKSQYVQIMMKHKFKVWSQEDVVQPQAIGKNLATQATVHYVYLTKKQVTDTKQRPHSNSFHSFTIFMSLGLHSNIRTQALELPGLFIVKPVFFNHCATRVHQCAAGNYPISPNWS